MSVSTFFDRYMNQYADSNPIWIATLSDGSTVYQDDDRPGEEPASAWERLGLHCKNKGLYITGMKIKNRSHVEVVEKGGDGYYFCKCVGKFMFGDQTSHSFIIGTLKHNVLKVRKWNLPEIIPDEFETRNPAEAGVCLITKNNPYEEV
jgi:YHS domain-containing protein